MTEVLIAHRQFGDDTILDNILNCPCMERCFNGAPCRTTGPWSHLLSPNRAARRGTVGNHEKGYFRHSQDETLTRIIIRHWVRNQFLLMVFNSGTSEMKKGLKS